MRDQELSKSPAQQPVGASGLRDRMLLALFAKLLTGRIRGRLTVTLPSGYARTIGVGGLHADLHLKNFHVLLAALRRGTLGFAECYMNGEVATSNLANVFRFFIDNRRALETVGQGLFRGRKKDLAYHAARDNTREGSRRNIAAHYDLGNDFYAQWLDPSMAYSSGIYLAPDMTLEDAQGAKFEEVIAALELAAGDRLLEIGCGWGGFLEAAARRGAHCDAITVSERQLTYTRARIKAAGLEANAQVRFEDYRDTGGCYDKIASIEMIEAVGANHWPTYFKTLRDRLRPGGIAAIQAITIREDSYEDYASRPDFIQRYIFPGGMLPTKEILQRQAEATGLTFETWKTFGLSYTRTLEEWRRRFQEQWPQISALGFDERFRRMWVYYLTYCAVGFEKAVIDVGIYRFRAPLPANAS